MINFQGETLGRPPNFVGWNFEHIPAGIYVLQSKHIENMLIVYNLTHFNSVPTPISVSAELSPCKPEEIKLSDRPLYIPLFDWNSLSLSFSLSSRVLNTSGHIFCNVNFVKAVTQFVIVSSDLDNAGLQVYFRDSETNNSILVFLTYSIESLH